MKMLRVLLPLAVLLLPGATASKPCAEPTKAKCKAQTPAQGCEWVNGECVQPCSYTPTPSACAANPLCFYSPAIGCNEKCESPQFGQQLEKQCGGIIGSFMTNITNKVTGLNETVCMMQGKTAGGGLTNGLICTGARNATLTHRYFDQPNRNFTCAGNNDKNVQVNGVYMLPTSQEPKQSCKGVIGSLFYDVPLLSGGTQKYCLMQGKTQFGGLQNGLVCTGVRNVTLTERIFDQPNRNFTCSDGTIFENGLYSTA